MGDGIIQIEVNISVNEKDLLRRGIAPKGEFQALASELKSEVKAMMERYEARSIDLFPKRGEKEATSGQ